MMKEPMTNEELVDPVSALGKECGSRIKKMRKDELTTMLVVTTLRGRVQDETMRDLEHQIEALRVSHKIQVEQIHEESEYTIKRLEDKVKLQRTHLNQASNIIEASTLIWRK